MVDEKSQNEKLRKQNNTLDWIIMSIISQNKQKTRHMDELVIHVDDKQVIVTKTNQNH